MVNTAQTGQIVLENRRGQVVRTLHGMHGRFCVVRRHDTGRVESVVSCTELDEAGIEYTLLAETSELELIKAPAEIGDGAKLRWVEAVRSLDPRHDLANDDSGRELTTILAWTAAANLGLIAVAFLMNYFFPTSPEVKESPIVQITVPPPAKLPEPVRSTVAPTARKIARPAKPVITAPPKVAQAKPKLNRNLRPTSFGHTNKAKVATGGANINQLGALAVLGAKSTAPVTGGSLNLKNVQFKNGSGGGGTGRAGNGGMGGAGKGGFAAAVAGQGLIAGSRGTGGLGLPSGGFGTRGKAGGQNGYGRANLSGGGDGYFQPLEADAEVEGGLDRDQINEVIQKNMGQILYCYEQGLQVKPQLSGRIGVRFVINGSGRVSTAGLSSSSMRAPSVEGCVLSKLKAFQFPQPVGGVNVKVLYPFQFQRVSQR